MATFGDDCYFFCTSTCVKGPSCQFRHVEAAKSSKIVCQHWQMGNCCRPMCKFRHSTFPIPVLNSETPCFWETQQIGCTKMTCLFKHSKPRPAGVIGGLAQAQTVLESSGSSQESNSTTKPDGVNEAIPLASQQEVKGITIAKPSSPEKVKVESTNEISSVQNSVTTSENKEAVEKDNSKTNNTENGNNIHTANPQEKYDTAATKESPVKKKIVKKAAAKKSTTDSTVKKTKIVKKVLVKKKVAKKVDNSENKKVVQSASTTAATKSVKDRLGMVSAPKKPLTPVVPPVESESGSESSDSVDNIKVLSMEEILRQKALESMMRKRAAEGKALPVSERKKDFKPAVAPVKAPVKKALQGKITLKKKTQVARPAVTPVVTARKTKLLAVAAPVSSESEEESSAETSGPSGSEDSDDSQDESEPDVRRVVVEVDKEAAARKRAKASLLKKQTALGHRVQTGKITKAKDRFGGSSSILDKKLMRRMVNVDYDSDDIISSHAKAPLSVKDRLGKPPRLHQAISLSQLGTKGRKTVPVNSPEKPAVIAQAKALMKDLSSSSEDDALEGIRVKTLEEIRQEKMSKAAGHTKPDTTESTEDDCRILSVKQRLGSVSPVRRNVLEDNDGGGRQVLIAADSGSKSDESSNAKTTVEQKKVKRRPWRSKKSMVAGALGETEEKTNVGDERTAVVISPDLTGLLDIHTPQLEDTTREETAEEESPFDRLKRRALQKKLQSLQQSKEFSSLARTVLQDSVISEERQGAGDVGGNVENKEKEVEEDGKESHKKHKHKHKHKHHKKSKKERQIYMPPALKNAASQEQETAALKEEISPIAGTAAPTIKVAPQRRVGPHPIGAAWAAGLSLSSKGSTHSARRPLTSTTASASAAPVPVGVAGVVGRLGQKPVEPGKKIKPISTLASSSEPTGAIIKSFSEIMAEKRRRRLEMQASQAQSQISASLSSFSQPSIASPQSTSPLKLTGAASSPIKVTDSRPRVPISPVVLSTDNQSSLIKPKFQVKSSASDIFSSEPAECATAPPSTSPNVQSIQPSLLSQSKAQNTPSSSSLSCIRQSTMPQHEVLSMPEVPENKKNAIKRGAKKSLGQKKLFKKRKSVEQVTACSPNKAPEMTESIGISIPLPPMTLEEELLLDDGSDSLMEIDRLSENIQTNEPRSSAVPKIDMYEPLQPFKQQQLLPESLATVPAVSSVEKHKSSPADNSEVSMKKDRLSIEDEFALFDEELENLGDVSSLDVGDSVEPIDDLLQNIDDLLA